MSALGYIWVQPGGLRPEDVMNNWTDEERDACDEGFCEQLDDWTTRGGLYSTGSRRMNMNNDIWECFFLCPTTRCIWDESFYSTWWTNEEWDACQDDICSAMWKKLSRWTTGCMWELQWLLDVVNNWPGEQGTAWGWFLFIEKLDKRTMKRVRKRFLSLRAVEKMNSEVRKKGRFLFDAMDSFADEQWEDFFFFNWWG